jgi:hypothetical protein
VPPLHSSDLHRHRATPPHEPAGSGLLLAELGSSSLDPGSSSPDLVVAARPMLLRMMVSAMRTREEVVALCFLRPLAAREETAGCCRPLALCTQEETVARRCMAPYPVLHRPRASCHRGGALAPHAPTGGHAADGRLRPRSRCMLERALVETCEREMRAGERGEWVRERRWARVSSHIYTLTLLGQDWPRWTVSGLGHINGGRPYKWPASVNRF